MARLIPLLGEEQLDNLISSAEARFYRACRDQLPDDFLVIYSAGWVYKDNKGDIREGEADFTIAAPKLGVLTVEVKGGGVEVDASTGKWFSTNRYGTKNSIKDPYRQAQSERHAILDQLTGHPLWRQWKGQRLMLAHAVIFPDIEDAKVLQAPNRPLEITGVRKDLKSIAAWVEGVMRYWLHRDDDPLGSTGVKLLEEILCKSVEVRPVLRSALDEAEQLRIRLTSKQAQILRIIGGRKRAVISGGAGTGKTLIAMEKARQLAQAGLKVLFLCYNRPLAEALGAANEGQTGLTILNFHRLCKERIERANRQEKRDLFKEAEESYPAVTKGDVFEVQWPFALALSNELLTDKFDAIIVDEAQDFNDEYWFSIEELLAAPKDGHLYIFIDQNQTLYPRHANLPVKDEPYVLTTNCRNTRPIHKLGYLYYRGEPVDTPELVGPEVDIQTFEDDVGQAAAIARKVRALVVEEKVAPSDLVILVAKIRIDYLFGLLQAHRITGSIGWTETPGSTKDVFVDTVKRFKGLESQAAILWLGDEKTEENSSEIVYVGTTRAKFSLTVVGSSRALAVLKPK